jgi:hypothetical protein
MRTTFIEMRLFNDDSQRQNTSFILNGKEWGVSRIERKRNKEKEKGKEKEKEKKKDKDKETKKEMQCIGEKGLWRGL